MKGYGLLEPLKSVTPHLWQFGVLDDVEVVHDAFETFLAATEFGGLSWKVQAVQVAEMIALFSADHIQMTRVFCRHLALRRLYSSYIAADRAECIMGDIRQCQHVISSILAPNPRSNAILGRLSLFWVQTLLDGQADDQEVQLAANSFTPLDTERVSRQEELVRLEGQFLHAKYLRFQGSFDEAHDHFRRILQQARMQQSRLIQKIIIHLGELESERGNHEIALDLLRQDQVNLSGYLPDLGQGSGRRLTLGMAHAMLLEQLDAFSTQKPMKPRTLGHIRQELGWLEEKYTAMPQTSLTIRSSLFQVRCGQAIVGFLCGGSEDALKLWEKARDAGRRCWPEPGYAFMITTYSMSQVAFKLHAPEATGMYEEARRTWNGIGRRRQHFFTGLGTFWPDILGDLEVKSGRERLMPKMGRRVPGGHMTPARNSPSPELSCPASQLLS